MTDIYIFKNILRLGKPLKNGKGDYNDLRFPNVLNGMSSEYRGKIYEAGKDDQ